MKKISINSGTESIELAYRDEGEGTTVIFLHAFPLSQRMWDSQIKALSASHRVLTFDWRGFGESNLGAGNSSMETFADDLAELLKALEIEQVVLCGLSMGGYAALAFYRKYSAKVSGLILADTKAGADTEEARRSRYEMAEQARQKGSSAIAELMIPKLLGLSTQQNNAQIAEEVKAIIANNAAEAIAAAQEGMAQRKDSNDLLAEISCPTLIIAGSEDTLTPPSEAETMGSRIRSAEVKIIDKAGHLSNLEQPEIFNQLVLKFLSRF